MAGHGGWNKQCLAAFGSLWHETPANGNHEFYEERHGKASKSKGFSPLSGVFNRFWRRILGIWSLSRFRCCPFRASSVECPWYLPGNPSSPLMQGKDWVWSTGRASNQAGACEMAGRVLCMEAGCTAMGEDEVKELEGQGLVAVGVPFWDLQHCNMRIACLMLSCWLATPSCSMFFVCGLRSCGKPDAINHPHLGMVQQKLDVYAMGKLK